MVNITFVSLLLFTVVLVQSETVVQTSNDNNETKSPISNQQLYELYKVMRQDPRFAEVSNQDIVKYIYRNFVLGNNDNIDYLKPKDIKQRRQRHRKTNQAE